MKFCNPNMVHLCFLPIAHIMEQVISASVLICGGSIGFLTGGREGLLDDCASLRPTVLFVVPRLMSTIYTKYMSKVSGSEISKKMYNYLSKKKLAEQRRGKFNHNSILDKILFGKLRKALGGRICAVVSGGSPLMPEIMDFARVAFGLVIEGYGSTETTSSISLTLVGEYETSIVGAINYNIEVKLVDVPDQEMFVSKHSKGEICVKGLRCTKGYYKDPVRTGELIDSEGWLHTGDIGQWTSGALQIVDRAKSIFKLSQGEYVAPEKVELIYGLCEYVNQIFMDGNSSQRYPVAIVIPNFVKLRSDGHKIGTTNYATISEVEICEDPEVNKFVLNNMEKIASERNLFGFEKVKAIHLTNEEFTVDNGFLTPTLKISRFKVRKHYAEILQNLY